MSNLPKDPVYTHPEEDDINQLSGWDWWIISGIAVLFIGGIALGIASWPEAGPDTFNLPVAK